MMEQDEARFGTYRCPVCGHRDDIELVADRPRHTVQCSYCGTQLELTIRGWDSVRLSVQVAEEIARG